MMDKDRLLAKARQQAIEERRAKHQLGVLVEAARIAGATWEEIANACGITNQGAQRRYAFYRPSDWVNSNFRVPPPDGHLHGRRRAARRAAR